MRTPGTHGRELSRKARHLPALLLALVGLAVAGWCAAQTPPADTDESAYADSTLGKILGGSARSQNDEAELAGPAQWFRTTATFTGRKRPASGRLRPLISAWVSSRGEDPSNTDLYFSGELPELEFEQAGRRHWIMAGLPGGLGFGVYPPGQKLTIYLQRVGFASGVPIAILTMAKLPDGASSTRAPAGRVMRNARVGEGERRQEGTYRSGSARFTYAGRQYTLPLDLSGRHSIAPGFYAYENGVRTALLEYGTGDAQYLLLRVPAAGDGDVSGIVPYLVLDGRIVPPIDLTACAIDLEPVSPTSARGSVDCSAVGRAVLTHLEFTAETR